MRSLEITSTAISAWKSDDVQPSPQVGFVRNADKGYSTGVAKVKIYGDDKLLFSKTISSDMKPFDIELDITGVVDLKIEMMGSFNGWDGMYAAIGNVMLQKVK